MFDQLDVFGPDTADHGIVFYRLVMLPQVIGVPVVPSDTVVVAQITPRRVLIWSIVTGGQVRIAGAHRVQVDPRFCAAVLEERVSPYVSDAQIGVGDEMVNLKLGLEFGLGPVIAGHVGCDIRSPGFCSEHPQ